MTEEKFNRLLKRVQTDAYSLEELHCFYYRRIVFHIGKKYGKTFAEDVAQDFFVTLLQNGVHEHIYSPTSWVLHVCDNLAKRKVSSDARYVYSPALETATEEDVAFLQETYGDLYYAIKKLDPFDRAIVDMYYYEGYTFAEIASYFNVTPSMIRQRHRRLLGKIKKVLNYVTFLDS